MPTTSVDDLSAQVARALAETWRTAWGEYGADFASTPSVRDAARNRALELLELAGRVWGLERSPDIVDLALAASMLRELADGFALMSNEWAPRDLSRLPFPVRDWLNIAFSALELDKWCEKYEQTLELDQLVSEVTWGPLPLSDLPQDLLAPTRVALNAYRSLLTRLATDYEARGVLEHRDELRAEACSTLAEARRDVFALRVAGADQSEVSIASVRVMLAESTFLVAGAADVASLAHLPIIRSDLLSELSHAIAP